MSAGRGGLLWAGALGLAAAAGAVFYLLGGEPAAPPADKPEAPAPVAAASPSATAAAPAKPAAAEPPAPSGGGVVVGRLVRGSPPVPVPGEVSVAGEGIPTRTATAGEDGRFSVEGLPCEAWLTLTAESPGLLPGRFPGVLVERRGRRDLGDLRLGPGLSIEVLVRDVGDRPVAGAAVAVLRSAAYSGSGTDWVQVQLRRPAPRAPEASRATDAGGRAVLEPVPPGEWTVRVVAEGFAAASGHASLEEGRKGQPVRIVLQRACSLEGTVFGADGKPLPGVLVIGADSGGWDTLDRAESTSDAAGAYALRGLEPGEIPLAVFPRPDLRIGVAAVTVPGVKRYDIRLGAGATVRGTVVDDATAAPLEGATVTVNVWPSSGAQGQAVARARTGPDGAFAIPDLPPGNFGGAQVSCEGFVSWPDSGVKTPRQNEALTAGQAVEVAVRLRRGAVVRGKVVDRAGAPVAAATVQARAYNPQFGTVESATALTAADGTYRLDAVDAGKVLVSAAAPGWFQPDYPAQYWEAFQKGKLPESCSVEVPASGEAVRDLVLSRGGVVEGTVVEPDGSPAVGARVWIGRKSVGGSAGGESGPTDAEGRFRVTAVGPAEDLVAHAGAEGRSGVSEPFALAEDGTAGGIRVPLKAGGSLSGRVRREDGGSAQGAALGLVHGAPDPQQPWQWEWQRKSAIRQPVGTDGEFRIERLSPGKYTLLCAAEGAGSVTSPPVEIAEGEAKQGVEVVLPAEALLAGKVVDGEGRPRPGASISVKEAPKAGPRFYFGDQAQAVAAVSDAEGAFTLRGLAAGAYEVTAEAPGLIPARATAKAGAADLVLVLAAGGSISGIVVEESDGRPIGEIPVQAYAQSQAMGPTQPRQATTAADGTFTLDGLDPAKDHTVTAGTQWGEGKTDHAPKTVPGVKPGTTDLRIALAHGLAIGGTIRDERGAAVTASLSIQARARKDDGTPDWTRQRHGMAQGGDGKFRLTGLLPGTYDLTVTTMGGPDADFAPASVRGVAAGTEDLSVVLRRGLPIRGRVLDEKGDPARVQTWLQVTPSGESGPQGGPSVGGQIQPDGTFTTAPLDPSRTYDLAVSGVAGSLGASAKSVPAGATDVILRIQRGGTISGRVVDEQGAGAGAGVLVMAQAEGAVTPGTPGAQSATRTGDDGTFTLTGLGEFRFRLTAGGGNTDWQPVKSTETCAPGATDVSLRTKVGARISGRLVDAAANPRKVQALLATADGSISQTSSYCQVAEDGTFTLKGLPPGKVNLKAYVVGGNAWLDCGAMDAPAEGVVVTVPDR